MIMNILHLSDIHFRRDYQPAQGGYKGMLAKMQSPLSPLFSCLKRIQAQRTIDLVIISGDLTEDGEVADYAYLKQSLKELVGSTPTIVTLGNHDIKANFRVGWLGIEPADEPYNEVHLLTDFAIISFDSSIYGVADGKIGDSQFTWLQEAFQQTQGKPVIFVTHHHLLQQQHAIPPLPEAERLLSFLKKQNILAILNGHTHFHYTGLAAEKAYFTVDSMSFCGIDEGAGMVRFEERYGYNLYTIVEGKLTQQSSETFLPGKFLEKVNMK